MQGPLRLQQPLENSVIYIHVWTPKDVHLPWWPASWTHGYLCFLYVWKNGVHWTIFRSFRQPEGWKQNMKYHL